MEKRKKTSVAKFRKNTRASVTPRIITEETTFLDAAINIAYEGNRALDIGDHILSAFIENRITGGKSDLITSKFSIEK